MRLAEGIRLAKTQLHAEHFYRAVGRAVESAFVCGSEAAVPINLLD